MAENERIYVAETTAGKGASGTQGRPVSLPVVELLTGRGFVTGKSGSGKSNTASVVAEELLDAGFGLLIVDVDGEYYGLKEEYEILHAGADEECDVQVTPDHGEKLATLALERNVPIILDVSGFLDEAEADAVLAAIAKHLFAKAKKQKQPFLMLVEEVHEYIPENGSVGEAGKLLIKIGKRGRKRGLGVCGISQRPADVKKDFITQCDWLCWHRLTWNNDTKVVRRVLDGEYASAVEDLDDGEGFLVTDWSDSVRRVTFRRKRTFDAGATPGLDDFERPELKSVSDGLVAELSTISEEQQARDDRIAELREELDQKNSRIAELEAKLADARDLSRMADQFVDALLEHVQGAAPGLTERERQRRRRRRDVERADGEADAPGGVGDIDSPERDHADAAPQAGPVPPEAGQSAHASDADMDEAMAAFDAVMNPDGIGDETAADGVHSVENGQQTNGAENGNGDPGALEGLAELAGLDGDDTLDGQSHTANGASTGSNAPGSSADPVGNGGGTETAADGGLSVRSFSTEVRDFEGGADNVAARSAVAESDAGGGDGRPAAVRRLAEQLEALDDDALAMVGYYRAEGPTTPETVAHGALGRDDRTDAYARNRTLRMAGLIEHVGRGQYDYCLGDTVATAVEDGEREEHMAEVYTRDLEQEYLED